MSSKQGDASRQSLLTAEQREFLREHQVMSIPQLHQLAGQIKTLRRIREQRKAMQNKQGFYFRPSAASAPWGVDLNCGSIFEGASRAQDSAAKQIKQPSKKAPTTPNFKPPAKRARQSSQLDKVSDVEEQDEDTAAESESDPDGKPARDIKLRLRKRVSFKLDDATSAGDAFQDVDDDQDSIGQSDGSGEFDRGQNKKKSKRKRQSSNSASSAEGFVEVEVDEPAQLMTMLPVKLDWDSDDEACNVCGDDEQAEGNEILLCDGEGCDVAVHQACYAVARVPRGKWYCDGCKDKLDLAKPNCVCCPVLGGALRKVPSLGPVKAAQGYPNKKPYLHLACALWTPEILISDPEGMRGPKLDALRQHRVDLTCAICKQAGGAVIQCSFGVCCRSFHVLCGRHVKAAAAFRHTDGHPLAFCMEHSKERYQRTREKLIAGDDFEPTASQSLEDVDAAAQAAVEEAVPLQPNDYEIQRQRNIDRNKQMLADLKRKSLSS
ncbi:hypothetical protein WJX77_007509 [Trebouxia sp. C0004]